MRVLSKAFIYVCLSFILSGCSMLQTATAPAPSSINDNSIVVFFTLPAAPGSASYEGGPDEHLAAALAAAGSTIDIAIYDLNLWSIRDALLAAHKRGVQVRMVTESDNLDETEIQQIRDAGIPVLGDRREGLMHNKFVIIDGYEIWTGSMNFTINDGYRNNNNLVRVHSARLAENYTKEFEEMFIEDMFGPDLLPATPHPSLTIDSVFVETYFSPDDGVAARLVELVNGAKESVNFMAFSFTSDDLADAMLSRYRSGVDVRGVFEESQVSSNLGGEYRRLQEAGLDVRLDGNLRNMHHKVIVIDHKTVVTGSYNFSSSAERRNDENVLLIHSPEIARQFLEEFERVYAEAQE